MRIARWLVLAVALSLALFISASHAAAQGGTPTTWRIYTHTDDVYALAVAPDGVTLWAATGGGVVRWDTASGARRVFTIDDGLPDNQTRDVLIDPATGYVWVGTYGGLARWNGASWRVWTTAEGLWAERVEGLGLDSAGQIWATTSASASVWDGVTMRKYGDICDALTANFTAVRQATHPTRLWAVEAGQRVWTTVGGGEGVRRHDGSSCQDFNTDTLPGLPSNVVVAVVATLDGAVWFGTQEGIARRDASGQMTQIGQGALPDSPVEAMTVDGQGRVWAAFGCEGGCAGGVARIDARGTANPADDQIQVFPMGEGGLPGRVPRAVAAAPGGGAWVGTDAGPLPISAGGSSKATLSYSVDGVSVSKPIERQVFSVPPTCRWSAFDRSLTTNFQDLWWNPAEPGWGMNIAHQGNILFATLFTYDLEGRGRWLVMSRGERIADGLYIGELYQTAGPPFNATPWTPATTTQAGTLSVQFTRGNAATITYTIDGFLVVKPVERQVFGIPATECVAPAND